jgi:hypothetical protein
VESAQYHLCPFGPQAIGNAINIRHVVGQPDNQGQLAVLPVWDRFIRLVYEADIESVWGQGSHRRKTDGRVAEQGKANAEGLVTSLRSRSGGDKEHARKVYIAGRQKVRPSLVATKSFLLVIILK